MSRPTSRYVCQSCGDSFLRWEGQCRTCGAWNTLVETLVREPSRPRAAAPGPVGGGGPPPPIRDLDEPDLVRLPTGIGELDRVLGGGLVPGSLVLIGGEPGVGKSTLVLAAAAGLTTRPVTRGASAPGDGPASGAAAGTAPGAAPRRTARGGQGLAVAGSGAATVPGSPRSTVLYASGEESTGQLRLRARRLGIADGPAGEAIFAFAETDVERIVERARSVRPAVLVVDSIQTVSLDELDGPPGSVGQVRESALRLLQFAKGDGIPVVLVGHVTKDGSLAGPKTLEHLVDAVLTLEGERGGGMRLLRATKNRFGSTEEVGVFAMGEDGLREVSDPARAFLAEAGQSAPGSAIAATLEGSRPLMVEVQALVAPAAYGTPRRTATGLDQNRLALLIAVLARRSGISLAAHDVYASIAGGLVIEEPALDLPLALALASSLRDRPVVSGIVAAGEIGLLGELRPVSGLAWRLREADRLGFDRAIVPVAGRSSEQVPERVGGLQVSACRTLREALALALASAAPEPVPF
jgi:DNA repair protein RadA/Sms